MNKAYAVDKLIQVAQGELGYLEKRSIESLDNKTANEGNGNYTKYWRDIYPEFQGQPWCAAFVSWCMMKAFGRAAAEKLLRHWPFVYCPTLGSLFSPVSNPEKGDIVLFRKNGIFAHTGIVVSVKAEGFETIEGNTSGRLSVVANGGAVCRKEYPFANRIYTVFCRPDYESVLKKLSGAPAESVVSINEDVKAADPEKQQSHTLNTVPYKTGTVTASALNVRRWAGTEYPRLFTCPSIPAGTKVGICDTVKAENGKPWYYVLIDGHIYGFVSAAYVHILSCP